MPHRPTTLYFVRKPGSTEYHATPATVRTLSSAEEFRAKLRDMLAEAIERPDRRAYWRKVAADPKLAKRHASILRAIRQHFPHVLAEKAPGEETP